MVVFILTIKMVHGVVIYGYRFIEKSNCEKVGKELSTVVKGSYSCRAKKLDLKDDA